MNMIAFESTRVATIKSSPSMAVSVAAKAMRAKGEHVVDLSLGEPDFDTPDHIVQAAIEAMRKGLTRYTAPDGLVELREAIVAKFKRENGLDYAMDEISIGNGAKQILFNAFLATLEPGDEVVVLNALLGLLHRHRRPARRHSEDRALRCRGCLQDHSRAAGSSYHAEDALVPVQFSVQSDGGDLYGGRTEGAWCSAGTASPRGDHVG